jgi:hypothetical protein
MATAGKPAGGKCDVPLLAGIGLSLLAATPFLAAWGAGVLAPTGLDSRRNRPWRACCFIAAWRAWVVAGLVLEWLAVGLHLKWFGSDFATLVFVALVVGIIAGAVFTPVMNLVGQYWSVIHDSLEGALETGPALQQASFNRLHTRLVSGRSKDRRVVLRRILTGS